MLDFFRKLCQKIDIGIRCSDERSLSLMLTVRRSSLFVVLLAVFVGMAIATNSAIADTEKSFDFRPAEKQFNYLDPASNRIPLTSTLTAVIIDNSNDGFGLIEGPDLPRVLATKQNDGIQTFRVPLSTLLSEDKQIIFVYSPPNQ